MNLLADLGFTFHLVRIEVVLKLLYSVAKETLVKAAKLHTKMLGYQTVATECTLSQTADVASRKQYSKHH